MRKFDVILKRCNELIQQAEDIIKNNEARKVTYIISSTENILHTVYSGNVPNHLNY